MSLNFFYNYKIAKPSSLVKNSKLEELVSLNVNKLAYRICLPFSVMPYTITFELKMCSSISSVGIEISREKPLQAKLTFTFP
jgi:hypothetical protein